jgi:hypothetical protein
MPASHSSSVSSSGRRPVPRLARLDRLRRLTARDHELLRWLAEHYVLSTDQIAHALFPSRRSARLRLAVLHELEVVSRFVDVTTGTRQYLYTLGPLGAVVYPTAFNDPTRRPPTALHCGAHGADHRQPQTRPPARHQPAVHRPHRLRPRRH